MRQIASKDSAAGLHPGHAPPPRARNRRAAMRRDTGTASAGAVLLNGQIPVMVVADMTTSDSDSEAPLNPEMDRVARKLRRLLAVSGLIMAAGLIAVFAAIFYRLAQREGPPDPPPAATAPIAGPVDLDVAIPAGAVLRGASLAGDRLVLTLDLADGSAAVWIVRLADGGIDKRVTLPQR
jgi:hypothetical protein